MSVLLLVSDVVMNAPVPIPTPTDPAFDPDDVTSGPVGFFVIFGLFIMVALVTFDLLRRVRRIKYREVVREQLEQEVAERDAKAAGDAPDPADPSATGDAGPASTGEAQPSVEQPVEPTPTRDDRDRTD